MSKGAEAVARWRKKFPEKYEAQIENARKARMNGEVQEIEYTRNLRNKYGLSVEDYAMLFESCGGKCAICGTTQFGTKRPHVDHDHETGKVRGLLCSRCNLGIGYFGDSPELLLEAAAYLRGFR